MFTWSLVESIELENLEMVRWVMDHFPDCNVSWEISIKIGGKGAIEIMRFLLESDPNSGEMVEEESDEEVESRKFRYGILNAAQAAYEGYGDLVRLMYEATGQLPRQNDITMASAVINGDIGLVQWLMTRLEMEPTKGMAETAAKGNIRMLQWMYEHRYGGEEDAGVLLRAAEEEHMDIVRWVIDRDWANEELDTDDEDDYYCDNWLGAHFIIRESCHITSIGGEASLAIHAAAIKGQLEIAKYLRARVDTPLDEMDKARRSRRVMNKLKELRVQLGEGHNGAEVSGKTMIKAAEKGFLDVVKWLFVEYGSNPKIDIFGFFDSAEQEYHSAIDAAAGDGHLDRSVSAPGGEETFAQAKLKEQNEPPKVYLIESFCSEGSLQETPGCTSAAMDSAAANGHLEIVRWLHQNRKEGCSTEAMDLAARNGEMAAW